MLSARIYRASQTTNWGISHVVYYLPNLTKLKLRGVHSVNRSGKTSLKPACRDGHIVEGKPTFDSRFGRTTQHIQVRKVAELLLADSQVEVVPRLREYIMR